MTATPLPLTPTDVASIVTVAEARSGLGLAPTASDGSPTISEYQAKNASTIAAAANAAAGEPTTPSGGMTP